ncbi:MAG TPA: glycosyl hydrolase family 28 protein [Bryobacteraceae bacterium]|nr:glycosyl hydrolase family 28 protein [Bryobacteraceae bacterium]
MRALVCLLLIGCPLPAAEAVFNVKDYGATGRKSSDARPAIQKALDAAGGAGGGTVYLPPGAYTSGTLHLRSHVRLLIDSGATLYASLDSKAFDKAALLYGEGVDNITIEGRGTLDGQAEYVWQPNGDFDDAYIRENMLLAKALGKPLMRSFPQGFPNEKMYPHLVLLLRCNDVRIAGLSFIRSRSWTINPYACRRLTIDGVYIRSSLKDAVWADGIDPDGCQDVRIANSTIETGDDAIVFYSSNGWGPALPCENITVTNCRLSSASSAIKFCDGNMNCIRHVTIDNTVITDSNRGIAFMVFDGGYVSDVVIANLTIQCRRHDWFWWGDGDPIHFNIKRRSEVDGHARANEPPAGSIRNVIIQNVVAHGMGSSMINGHPDSWLDGVTLDNIKLFVSNDPESPLQKTVEAMQIRWARNLRLKNVEIAWEKPDSEKWRTPLRFEDVRNVELDNFSGRPATAGAPAIAFSNVDGATVRDSTAAIGTGVFLELTGTGTRGIRLVNNDLEAAHTPYRLGTGVRPDAIRVVP